MKQKFIIGRHNTNDHWDYFSDHSNGIFDTYQNNHFIGNTPENAKRFDTYVEAQTAIEGFGIGIFKIDKIFINDTI